MGDFIRNYKKTNMKIKKIAFLVLISFLPIEGFTQEVPENIIDTLSKNSISVKERQIKEAGVEFNPSPVKNTNSFLTSGNFLSTISDQKVEANLGFILWDYGFGLSLSAPISKDKKETKPITFSDGLSNATSISLSVTKFFWNPKLDIFEFKKIQDRIRQEMKSLITTDSSLINVNEFIRVLQRQDYLSELDEFNEKFQKRLVEFQDTIQSQKLKLEIYNFIDKNVNPTWATMNEKQKNLLDSAVNWDFPAYFLGLQAKIGRIDFSYALDSMSINDIKKTNETNWSLIGGVGLAFGQNSVLSLNVAYSVGYKGKEESDFQILNPNGLITTKKFAFGAPTKNEDYKVTLSYKWLITEAFGISPSFTGSFNEKKVGLDLPIYFFQLFEKSKDEKKIFKGLNGGIFFSWISPAEKFSYLELNEDNLNAGIFVGATLDPLNSLFK